MALTSVTTPAKAGTVIVLPSAKQANALLEVVSIVVSTPEQEAAARKHLNELHAMLQRIETDKETLKRPHLDACQSVDKAVKAMKEIVRTRYDQLNSAIVHYEDVKEAAARAEQAKINKKYEVRVEKAIEKAEETGEPMKNIAPPALVQAPARTVMVEGAQQAITGYWTWDGIKGVESAPGQPEKIKLSVAQAKALGLDLPEDWFMLDTARITKSVKGQDRVPTCILQRYQKQVAVTQAKEDRNA